MLVSFDNFKNEFLNHSSINEIQLLIKIHIYQELNVLIDKQNEQHLKTIMEKLCDEEYYVGMKELICRKEILQFKTAKSALQDILPNLKQHLQFIKDQNNPNSISVRPISTNHSIKKNLEF